MSAENGSFIDAASSLVPKSYVALAEQAKRARNNRIDEVLRHKKMPKVGWDDLTIEYFINELALMDSNNFLRNIGVGEREGRVYSDIVAKRHFRLSHGIGRSGDIKSVQPKAAGSSLVNSLTNCLALDAIRIAGIKGCKSCFVVPCATGMALTLCLLSFRRLKPKSTHVIWSRIDQKSCFKCILTAGFEPYVVPLKVINDELSTDLAGIEVAIAKLGIENVACIFTTTSCFAPRIPDDVIGVGRLCKKFDIPHLVNNAYGLQCESICNKLEEAGRNIRIDAFVQSTDKNFMVPVGGAIIAGFDSNLIESIAQTYPGRASASPSTDLLITLLSLGADGFRRLRVERLENFVFFKSKLEEWAKENGEHVLQSKKNFISMAVSLSKLDALAIEDGNIERLTLLGSMLFTRQCSGARVVPKESLKVVDGYEFRGWMSHFDSFPCSYLNVAAAIGVKREDIDQFFIILSDCYSKIVKNVAKGQSGKIVIAEI